MDRVEQILKFWFGDDLHPGHQRHWFAQDAGFDRACRTAFMADYESAAAGNLEEWKSAPSSILALILLLDQFPRNMFRGTPRAFATDPMARAAAKHAIAHGLDRAVAPACRPFNYLPFEHSENLDDQYESVRLFHRLAEEHPALADYVPYADGHFETIYRFGRFPHRNAILGRASTPEEIDFLRHPRASRPVRLLKARVPSGDA
jgi:uncharacterized protein (DUF924 family)